MVKCPVCGAELKYISIRHIRSHGYDSKEEFLEAYPETQLTSQEVRDKNRESIKKKWDDPEAVEHHREKWSKSMKEYHESEESAGVMSQRAREMWSNPSYRRNRKET